MDLIQKNVSLKMFNTMSIEATASFFIELTSEYEIQDFTNNIHNIPKPIFFLGHGANTLFTKDYTGTVVYINTKGIQTTKEDKTHIYITVKAGEIWDDFVNYCTEKNYYGVENLISIPSKVGAVPIQNIGAYGVEAKDVIHNVKFFDLQELKHKCFDNKSCKFEYRGSIFKHELKNKVLITEVCFKLNKIKQINISYGSIKDEFKKTNIQNPTPKDIANIISYIRNSKLPDYKQIGNAGSFFKNPIITESHYQELKIKYPNIIAYPLNDNMYKIAAGWLIDNAGLKGHQIGGAAVHKDQALVIINKKNASAKDIVLLSKYIQNKIHSIYNIELHPEVIFV